MDTRYNGWVKKKPHSIINLETICLEILKDETGASRKLNWMAMHYFLKHQDYFAAAICRDRVKSWNENGPL